MAIDCSSENKERIHIPEQHFLQENVLVKKSVHKDQSVDILPFPSYMLIYIGIKMVKECNIYIIFLYLNINVYF